MLDVTQSTTIRFAALDLAGALKKVRLAISTEETRHYLNGVYVERDGDRLAFTATDGHRLARVRIRPDIIADFSPCILPAAAVADIIKASGNKTHKHAYARLAISPGRVSCGIGDAPAIDYTPIDGTFPDYRRIIPGVERLQTTVNRETLHAICAGMAAGLSKACKALSVRFAVRDTTLTLSSIHDVGPCRADAKFSVSATLPCEAPAEPFEIGFNVAFVRDVLAALDGQGVTLNVADMGSPARFTGCDPNEIHVVMQMRV